MAKLSERHKRFCDEYLIDLNVTQAAIRAGYTPKYANKKVYALLDKPEIKEYLDKRMNAREKRTEITQDKVLSELAAIAFSNASDFFKVIDKKITVNGNEILDTYGKPKTYKDVEFINTDNLSDDNKKVISSIKQGANGLEIKLNDKIKALELVGRHLGMFKDKVEINGNVNNPFEGLTTEQLLKMVADEDG
ncbi:terminase small subunit [Clostridium botulinum]|uniref:Terminase small subunit n=1 Tax=Clostridium botulinum TaxID=1491 RepID=A0A6M0SUE4_CLOBO|nr:terminase small subunit [Clostridium botulinum]